MKNMLHLRKRKRYSYGAGIAALAVLANTPSYANCDCVDQVRGISTQRGGRHRAGFVRRVVVNCSVLHEWRCQSDHCLQERLRSTVGCAMSGQNTRSESEYSVWRAHALWSPPSLATV